MSAWSKAVHPAQTWFRKKRAERILKRFPEINGGVVIDVGGSLTFWKSVGDILKPARVIIYNISAGRMQMGLQNRTDYIETHIYDGHTIPEADGTADVVICNSVIEHVPLENRARLVSEIARVGKRFVVQTPAYGFPLELHFGLPFIHWLPRSWGRLLVRASPFALMSDASSVWMFDQTQLLRKPEFKRYFPDADMEVEYFLGMPKSVLVFG
ncbi:class I SAM-dependent methyltransferase [Erythrobacter sp. NE805]|uniref:class I SAM-dependent methyltransferase n=1 Tax=Erythrobacter sp. NE805 TaxID=3389875 RepID=UPI00396B41D6